MQMVSTKVEEQHADAATYDSRPRLYLDDDIVEKLGLASIPAPGTVFAMQARAVAESVTASAEEAEEVATEGNKPDVRMCLIITDVGLSPAKTSDTERATLLYGGE